MNERRALPPPLPVVALAANHHSKRRGCVWVDGMRSTCNSTPEGVIITPEPKHKEPARS